MTALSEAILAHFQMRKTKRQKLDFIALMQEHFPALCVEEGGFGHNRNLVLGDVKTARVLLGAHYDTCARLPFPNFITPLNIPLYIGFNLLIVLPFLVLYGLLRALLPLALGVPPLAATWIAFAAMMALLLFVFMGGKPNPHTANDNTSGVIELIELYSAMDEATRAQVALVFFDNEENGLLGSAWFAKIHRKDNLKDKLMLNFDCVSDGDHLLFVLNKPARERFGAELASAMEARDGKTCRFERSSRALYPSDQANFPVSAAVAALNRGKVGLYMNRIHTARDTVFDARNIRLLCEGTQRFLQEILQKSK